MLSRWPRLRRLLKWAGLSFLLVLVLLGGVYLLRDKLLAKPLANLVAEQMSAALGGKFTLERIEGNYFSELVVVGLRTETEPPEGPLRRIDLDRATVRFSLLQMFEDPIAAILAVEGSGVVVDIDLDRPSPPSEEPLDLADVLPKTFPQVALDARVIVRADGREFTIEKVTASGGGDAIDLRIEGLDLAGELASQLLRLRVEHPTLGTFVVSSDDALAGVTPRRVAATILGPLSAEAELGFADGDIRATFTEQEATFSAKGLAVAQLPVELRSRVPEGTQLPSGGVIDIEARVLRPLADDLEANAVITVNRLDWTDWRIDVFEVKGAWSDGVARLESMDARIDDGFIRARDIELRPELDLPLTRLDLLEIDLPDLRVPLRRLGIVDHLPADPISFKLKAHRAAGAPVTIDSLALSAGPTRVQATGEFTLPSDVDKWDETPITLAIDGVFDARSLPAEAPVKVLGAVTVKGRVGGTPAQPTALLDVQGRGLMIDNTPIETLEAKGNLAWPRVELESLSFVAAPGSLVVKGSADLEQRTLKNGSYTIDISSLEELAKLIPGAPAMKGVIRGSGRIQGVSIDGEREGDADLVCENLEIDGLVIDAAKVRAAVRGDTIALPEFSVQAPAWNVAGSADATFSLDAGTVAATLKTLKANAAGQSLELRGPTKLNWDGKTATLRDLDATVLGGRIEGRATYGDNIELQLKAAGLDVAQAYEDAQGLLGFELNATGTMQSPRWNLTVASSGLQFQQQQAKVDVRVHQDDRGIHIGSMLVDGVPKLKLSGSGFVPIDAGAEGIRFLAGEPTLTLSVEVTPGGLAPYLPSVVEFSKATFETSMRGNSIDGVFRLRDLRWTEAPDDFIAGDTVIQLRAGDKGMDLILEGSELGPLMAEAKLHTDAALDWKDPAALTERIRTAPISGSASFFIPDLQPLAKLPGSPIAHGEGTGTIDVKFSGTPLDPHFEGTASIKSPRVRLQGDIPALQDVVAKLRVTEAGLTVEQFTAQLGYEPLTMTGGVTFPSAEQASVVFDIHLSGKNVLLSRTPYLRLRSDLDIFVKGPIEKIAASGEVVITNMLWSEPLKLLSNGGATAADSKLHLFSIREEPLKHMTFDVAVKADDTIRLDNNVLRGLISANLRLRGTGAVPRMEGRADFRDLSLTFPITRERLKVTRGSLVFPHDDPFRPSVNASCEARKLGYEMTVEVTGKIPDIEVHITSIPALPRDEAILLLTTGTTRERLAASGQMTAGLYLGRSILDVVMGPSDPDDESFLERFEFESGKDVSAAGDPTMEARFRLSKRFYVTAERDRWDDYNGGLMLRLKFR